MAAPRFGLYGPYGWGNLGDAAIQESMLANLRARWPEAQFVGISLNPTNTTEIHGIDAVPILRTWLPPRARVAGSSAGAAPVHTPPVNPPARWKQARPVRWLKAILRPLRELLGEVRFGAKNLTILRSLDRLVISGGGQITDDWGGPLDHPWSMFSWVLCARLAGVPVSVVSVGAGPIDSPWSRRLFFAALRMAENRSVRDEESREFLRHSGCTLPVEVCADLAFSHPLPDKPPKGDQSLVVGISPMSYMHPQPGVWPEHDAARYQRHLDTLEGFTRSVIDAGYRVRLFCNQIRNDRFAFDDLVERLGPVEGLEAEPSPPQPQKRVQVAGVDLVVTSRLHGVILSYLQSVPVIALSYEEKIDAVMRQFGQTGFCLDIDAVSAENLQERFEALMSRREAIRASIAATTSTHRTRLDAQYDRLFGIGEAS
jgi:polysaccharide pyruvyl transferase WcaK-like protein